MGVRPLGVEVIDRDPVELRPEVLFDLCHQPPDIGFEVGIFGAVLGRDDESELVPVTGGTLEEIVAVAAVGFRAVQLARPTLACDAVARAISHIGSGRLPPLACAPDQARLDPRPAPPAT